MEREISEFPQYHKQMDEFMIFIALEFLSIDPDEKRPFFDDDHIPHNLTILEYICYVLRTDNKTKSAQTLIDGDDFIIFLQQQTMENMRMSGYSLIDSVNVSVSEKVSTFNALQRSVWKIRQIFTTSINQRIESLNNYAYKQEMNALKNHLKEQREFMSRMKEQHRLQIEHLLNTKNSSSNKALNDNVSYIKNPFYCKECEETKCDCFDYEDVFDPPSSKESDGRHRRQSIVHLFFDTV